MTDRSDVRTVYPAGYAVGLMLILIPAIELAITSWPPQPGLLNWRFGAVGLVANSLLFPVIGLGILLFTAELLGHARVQRGLSVFAAFGCVLLIAAMAVFALDVLQLRSLVRGNARVGYDAVVVKATLNLGIAAFAWGALAVLGIRAAMSRGRHVRAKQAHPSPVVPGRVASRAG
jgi:hypothetical protein